MKSNYLLVFFIFFLFFPFFSCSIKNSGLKKGAEMEKLGNFKEASKLYLGILNRKSNLPEIENALRRSSLLYISETAFSIATKNEKGDVEGVVNDYYNLSNFISEVNIFTKNIDVDQQTKAIYFKNLDQYLIKQYDLGIRSISEQKFTEAQNIFNDISRFNPNYKDTSKQLNISINEPFYIMGVNLFSEKKYIQAYEKWNIVYNRDVNYKDIKNKMQQALNERYKEGNYYLMQENFKEAELAFEEVKNINDNYLEVKNLYRESVCEPIYRKASRDIKNEKCRTAYFGFETIIKRFNSYKNSDELISEALTCAEYPIIIESYRQKNSNGFETTIQNAIIEEIIANKSPFVKVIKGSNDLTSPYYRIDDVIKNNEQLKRYMNNSYIKTKAKAVLTIHINEFQLVENLIKSTESKGIEIKKIKSQNDKDSIIEKIIDYNEFEKNGSLQSSITYRLIDIESGKILIQKTINKNAEQNIKYARNSSSNFEMIYPTYMIGSKLIRDESKYSNLQTLFQNSDQLNRTALIDTIISDFRKRIVSEILLFNPEE